MERDRRARWRCARAGSWQTIRSRLVRSQEDWVRVTRNGCNEDDTCLTDVYERRIDILRRIDNRGSIEPNGIH
jgi:uncharacterized protein